MNYQEAIDYIHSTLRFGSKLGLENINYLLNEMGNPHGQLKIIHVAGTNGKGSTTAFIASILRQAGYKVGMFISPYLEEFSERIQINGNNIDDQSLINITMEIKGHVEGMISLGKNHPTEFEIITAMGFKYFAEQKVDFVVLEVGLGGRYDSTNVVTPLVSVITSISYDHTDRLGKTLGEIAYQKAGIIKDGGIVVCYPQQQEAYDVIFEVAREKNARLISLRDVITNIKEASIDGQVFDLVEGDNTMYDIEIRLLGQHQTLNAATAIAAIKALSYRDIYVDDETIYKGLKTATWPGRMEVMSRSPLILIDGAHNPDGARVLATSMKKYAEYSKLILVFGMLKDKDVTQVIREITPIADTIIVTKPNSDRAMEPEELALLLPQDKNIVVTQTVKEATVQAEKLYGDDCAILFAGSLYMIGEARTILRQKYTL